MQRRKLGALAVAVVAVVVAGGLSRLGAGSGSSSAGRAAAPAVEMGGAGSAAAAGHGSPAADAVSSAPAIGLDVIRTEALTLAVKPQRLRAGLDAIGAVAQRFGGYLASSRSTDLNGRRGQAVVRVPAARFQPALAAIERLGAVRSQSVSGRDVSSRVLDLHARLVDAAAQRRVLLALMARATTIAGSIAVERRLEGVELTIEQLQGDLRQLANRTSLATITVDLVAAGRPPAAPAGTLGGSVGRSLRAAERVVAAVVVGLGYLLPIAAIAALIYAGWRGLRRLAVTRRPASAAPPAGEAGP